MSEQAYIVKSTDVCTSASPITLAIFDDLRPRIIRYIEAIPKDAANLRAAVGATFVVIASTTLSIRVLNGQSSYGMDLIPDNNRALLAAYAAYPRYRRVRIGTLEYCDPQLFDKAVKLCDKILYKDFE